MVDRLFGPDADVDRQALALFEAMLEVGPDEREAWLAERTDGMADLRAKVTRMASADGVNQIQTGGAIGTVAPPPPPARIGCYRLTDLIGVGGMGSVWAAERDKGDFEHKVAIKLIKPGPLSEHLAERFGRERQLLARINHPNIARLFDGGETEDGQPYFVMEWVDGIPLGKWVADHEPSLDESLAIFGQICDAVAYAHRNLILHRDLTPGNVLIDADRQAKLIDFGIAQVVDEETGEGAPTGLRHLTMTPGFVAPERERGDPSSTLSDIYSAGKLLETMLPKPLNAELQAVIARACACDPGDRYQTIDALGRDVEAYSEGRPVSAVPGGGFYRTRKLIGRNKAQATLIAVLVIGVLGGIGAAGWNWREAERARDAEQERFSQVRGIANYMLFDLYDELEQSPGNTKSLTNIAKESKAYLEQLATGDNLSPELRFELAQGFHRLSNVLGNPEGSNLGKRDEAREALDRAIAELDALHREFPDNRSYANGFAKALYSDAILKFISEEDNEGAIESADRSASLYRTLLTGHGSAQDRADRLKWFEARLEAAKPFVWIDRGKEGVARLDALAREVLQWREENPEDVAIARLAAGVLTEGGVARTWHFSVDSTEYREAVPMFDKALRIHEGLLTSDALDPAVARQLRWSVNYVLFQRSLAHSDLEQWSAAYKDLVRATAITDQLVREDPDDDGAKRRREVMDSQMINVLLALGRKGEATTLAKGMLDSRAARWAQYPDNAGYARDSAGARVAYAQALSESGQGRQACGQFASALKDWEAIEQKWGLTSIDRQQSVDYAREGLRGCPGAA